MISVVIDARGGAEALARLLAGLVPAAADGVVREVLVFGADARSRDVADDAGARICADFAGAATAAKGPWLALLPLTHRRRRKSRRGSASAAACSVPALPKDGWRR